MPTFSARNVTSTILHNNRVGLRETWASHFTIPVWWCCVTTVWIYKGLYGKKTVLHITAEILTLTLDEPAERSIVRTLRSPPLVRVNLLARLSARASKMSMAGAGSMISESRLLTFFDSELCTVRCGDQFGLEFNWKGVRNPVQRFCGGIGAVGWISEFFFSLRAWVSTESSVQPSLFLSRGKPKKR